MEPQAGILDGESIAIQGRLHLDLGSSTDSRNHIDPTTIW
jgi:hypothetical protein